MTAAPGALSVAEAVDMNAFRSCAMIEMTADDVARAIARIIADEDVERMRERLADSQKQQRAADVGPCRCKGPHSPRCVHSVAGAYRREELYRAALKRVEQGK
jgi:hypothetical protein